MSHNSGVLARAYGVLARCELKEREHQAWLQRRDDVRDDSAEAWHREHREGIERERLRDERERQRRAEQSQPKAPMADAHAVAVMRTVDEAIYARNLVEHDYLWRNLDRLVEVIAEECGRSEKQVRGDFAAGDAELRVVIQALLDRVDALEAQLADQQAQLEVLTDDVSNIERSSNVTSLRKNA